MKDKLDVKYTLEEIPIECYVTREGNLVKFVRNEKIQELQEEIERLNNIINSIDTRLIEMGVDNEMLDVCEMYDVNGIELRKMIKELKGSDKE